VAGSIATTRMAQDAFATPEEISPLTDEAAIGVAHRWATGRYPLVGRLLPSIVTAVERRPVNRYHVTYNIRTRQIVVKIEPVPRKVHTSSVVREPSRFNPWDADIEQRLLETRSVAICPTCNGVGQQTCAQCGGSLETTCDACSGGGWVISERSGKRISCRRCAGDGRRRCACRDGIVACTSCVKKGVVTAWLEVVESRRVEMRVAGDQDFISASDDAFASNIKTVSAWAGTPNSLPDDLRIWLSREQIRYDPNHWTERVEQVSVRHTQSDSAATRFSLAGEEGEVTVNGWNGVLQVQEQSVAPFRALKRRLRWAMLGTFVGATALAGWFTTRHSYFAQSPEAGFLIALAFALPVAVAAFVASMSRPQERRNLLGSAFAAMPVLLILVLQSVLVAGAGPSVEQGQRLRRLGDLPGARREFRSAAELGRDVQSAQALHDDVQLEILEANRNPSGRWSEIPKTFFFSETARQKAEARATELTAEVAGGLQEKGQFRESLALLTTTPSSYRASPAIQQRLQNAYRHEADTLWLAIQAKRPNNERLKACDTIRPLFKSLNPQSSETKGWSPSAVEKSCSAIKSQEAERVRLEEAAARATELRAARAAAAVERARERARASSDMAPLMCRDGSLSPSCVCGGSRRGCCSHHGGVAGCSQSR
jgi:hypothetical protein